MFILFLQEIFLCLKQTEARVAGPGVAGLSLKRLLQVRQAWVVAGRRGLFQDVVVPGGRAARAV